MHVPARLQSGRGLAAILIWSLLGHLVLLSCAALSDLAAGGDFLHRWMPGGGASLAEPWVGAPPIARLLAILMAGLTGVSLARSRFGRIAPVVVGALVLVPWAHRGFAFLFAGDGLALQVFLPAPFWLLGLMVGYGLTRAWQIKYAPEAPDFEPTTQPQAWLAAAGIILVVTLGLGEAGAKYAASVAWNGYVDRIREEVAELDCQANTIARIAFVETYAPDAVIARVAGGCESMVPRRTRVQRERPKQLEAIRPQRPARGLEGVKRQFGTLDEEERARHLAILYQGLYGSGAQKISSDLSNVSTIVRTVRDTGVPTVVFDVGSLTHLSTHPPRDPQAAGLAANRTLDAVEIIGFDALCPGRGDLALGLDWLRMQADLRGLPYVSANLFDAEGRQVFPSHRVVQAGSWRVGVVGVTGANKECTECDVRDPVEAVRAAVEELRRTSPDVVVCMGGLYGPGFVQDADLVRQVEGIDLFLGTSSSTGSRDLEWASGTLLSRTRSRNALVEVLTVASVLGGQGFHSEKASEWARKRQDRLVHQIAEAEQRLEQNPNYANDYLREQLEANRDELATIDAADLSPDGKHQVTLRHLPGTVAQPDPEVAAALQNP